MQAIPDIENIVTARSIAMINRINRSSLFSILLVIVVALTGCGKSHSPSKKQVQDRVAASLLAFLSLDKIDVEPISTGPESVKVNFKAVVVTKEDLYQVDREVDGTPKVTLIRAVQVEGTKVNLYGFIEAHRMMDVWSLDLPHIQVGLDQFGKPRGFFDSQSYATGSSEAASALRQQAINADIQERERKSALDRQERERIVREEHIAREKKALKEQQEQARLAYQEQQKKEKEHKDAEEAIILQKLLQATAPGTCYIGTISAHNTVSNIRLVFIKQDDLSIRAEVNNPDVLKERQVFIGKLVPNAEPEKNSSVVYHIFMNPLHTSSYLGGGSRTTAFYHWPVPLKLRLTDTGMEGEANYLGEFILHLQRREAYSSSISRDSQPVPKVIFRKDGDGTIHFSSVPQ